MQGDITKEHFEPFELDGALHFHLNLKPGFVQPEWEPEPLVRGVALCGSVPHHSTLAVAALASHC